MSANTLGLWLAALLWIGGQEKREEDYEKEQEELDEERDEEDAEEEDE